MPEPSDPRRQAQQFHSFVLGLLTENERLRQQVQSLQQTLDMLQRSQPPLDADTVAAWGKRLAQNPAWKDIRLGKHSWNHAGGYPDTDGLQALLLDLTAVPGDDAYRRQQWDRRQKDNAKQRERSNAQHGGTTAYTPLPYPPRFSPDYPATSFLRQRGDAPLADTLASLLKGLRAGTKLHAALEAVFLLYGADAVRVLNTDPDEVVRRLQEEVRRATEPYCDAAWRFFGDFCNGKFQADATAARARSVLGVTPDATADEVKAAYRRLARQHHPDAGGDAEAFQKVSTAYEVLTA